MASLSVSSGGPCKVVQWKANIDKFWSGLAVFEVGAGNLLGSQSQVKVVAIGWDLPSWKLELGFPESKRIILSMFTQK